MADNAYTSILAAINAPDTAHRPPSAYVGPQDAGARYYADPALARAPNYRVFLESKTDEQCLLLLRELFDYFGIHESAMPMVPPYGLTGRRWDKPHDDDFETVSIGYSLLISMVVGMPGREIAAWADAREMRHKLVARGAEQQFQRQIEADARASEQAQEWARQQSSQSVVYFISTQDGPVKIGVATCARKRLRGLQTSHPDKLAILCTVPGDAETERAYHRRFAEHRLSGEWFERHPDILAEIGRINAERNAA